MARVLVAPTCSPHLDVPSQDKYLTLPGQSGCYLTIHLRGGHLVCETPARIRRGRCGLRGASMSRRSMAFENGTLVAREEGTAA
jgi:hypothetical protein